MHALADVDAGRRADAADEARSEVADDIPVKVAHDEDVELLRLGNQLHAAIVDDDVLRRQLGKFLGDGTERFQKQAIGELQNVGLMNASDRLAAAAFRPCESKAEKPLAGRLGDDLQALYDARDNLVLDRRVQVFRQFAENEEVHAGEAGFKAADILQGPNGGKNPELVPKLDVVIVTLFFG